MRRAVAASLVVALLVLIGIALVSQRARNAGPGSDPGPEPGLDGAMIGRFARSRFYLEHDRFLPSTDPSVVPGDEARFLNPESEVFGVVVGGGARAYPVPMLSYHHVVNDVINGIPIAVTY